MRQAGIGGILRWSAVIAGILALGVSAARAWPDRERPGALWVDALTGEPVVYARVLADLAETRVIYLGERHGDARHHGWQARIVTDLAARAVPTLLALEQMEAHYQPVLDRYGRGEIDFATLARESDWAHRWPGFEAYRPVLEAARQAGAPLLALNARQETIRQIARGGGVAALSPRARAELPATLALDDPLYERYLHLQLSVHPTATPARLRPMVEAQIARDEMMAQRLADALRSAAGRGRTAVVLTGAGHVAFGLGMPARVRRHLPEVDERIVLFSAGTPPSDDPESRDYHAALRALARPLADYLSVWG